MSNTITLLKTNKIAEIISIQMLETFSTRFERVVVNDPIIDNCLIIISRKFVNKLVAPEPL